MSFRRIVTTIAVAATTAGGLALGGSAAATTKAAGKPAATEHPGTRCGGAVVQSLTTTLSGEPVAMTLELTLSRDLGRVVAVVGGSDGVAEYGALAPVSGHPGSYTGVFLPPSGTPVADGDTVLVLGCGDHWLTRATIGTPWTAGPGASPTASGKPTTKPGGTSPTEPTSPPSSPCIGAQVLSVSSALTSDGTGVSVTITVNHSLGRSFSAYVQAGGQMVAAGSIPEQAGQPGTYEGTLTAKSGSTIPADAQVVFGSCGGTANRIGGTTTVGSSTWTPVK